jgi:hypothetical protein
MVLYKQKHKSTKVPKENETGSKFTLRREPRRAFTKLYYESCDWSGERREPGNFTLTGAESGLEMKCQTQRRALCPEHETSPISIDIPTIERMGYLGVPRSVSILTIQ